MRADQHARRDAFLGKIGTRPVVMGILNVTADSFSDGGRFVAVEAALAHAQQLAMHGCDQDRLDLGRLLGLRYRSYGPDGTVRRSLDGQVPRSSLPEVRWREARSQPALRRYRRSRDSMVNRLPDGPLRSSAAKTSQRGYHSFNERTAQFALGNGP
jgi:Pterin binding enzyme